MLLIAPGKGKNEYFDLVSTLDVVSRPIDCYGQALFGTLAFLTGKRPQNRRTQTYLLLLHFQISTGVDASTNIPYQYSQLPSHISRGGQEGPSRETQTTDRGSLQYLELTRTKNNELVARASESTSEMVFPPPR